MSLQNWTTQLSKKVSLWPQLGVFLFILLCQFFLNHWIQQKTAKINAYRKVQTNKQTEWLERKDSLEAKLSQEKSNLSQLKMGLPQMAQTKKNLYESGLELQEEKRVLEKQLDIIVTAIKVDPEASKVYLLKNDQITETYPIVFGIPQSFGEKKTMLPQSVRIISKERFAHPERGKAEKVGDTLVWEPPQVGTSARSSALGEFVIFTDSPLVLHGPPLKPEEHEKYPHTCLGLPMATAKALYQKSYIGTKIYIDAR